MGRNLDGLNAALSIISQKSVQGVSIGDAYEKFNACYSQFDVAVKLGTTELLIGAPHAETLAGNIAKVTSVELEDDVVTVVADFAGMTSFVGGAGDHKYISLIFTTGEDGIIGINYHTNPDAAAYAFTSEGVNNDVDEATVNGGEAGDFVLFPMGELITTTPKVFMLTKTGFQPKVITVRGVQA